MNVLGSINSTFKYNLVNSVSMPTGLINYIKNIASTGSVVFNEFNTNQYDGNVTNSAVIGTYSPQPNANTAYAFNVGTSYTQNNIKVQYTTALPLTMASGMTIMFWLRPVSNPSGADGKFMEFDGDERFYLFFNASTQKYNWCYSTNAEFSLPINTWSHVTITTTLQTSTTGTYSIYVNGTLTYSNINYNTGVIGSVGKLITNAQLSQVSIGRSISSAHIRFAGYISDFRIYNAILNAQQILQAYGS